MNKNAQAMGKLSWDKRKELQDSEHFRKLGRKGAKKRWAKKNEDTTTKT